MKQGVDKMKILGLFVDNFVKLALNNVKKSGIFIYAVLQSNIGVQVIYPILSLFQLFSHYTFWRKSYEQPAFRYMAANS
jgi:hypothetical protein